MKWCLTYCLVVVALLVLECKGVPAVGGKKQLTDSDLNDEHVSKAAKFATSQIHKKKLKNSEYDDCVGLAHKLLRGTKQVVAGVKYSLEMKVYPLLVQSDLCKEKKAAKKLIKSIKPELCEAEILWRPWAEPNLQLLRSVCLKVED